MNQSILYPYNQDILHVTRCISQIIHNEAEIVHILMATLYISPVDYFIIIFHFTRYRNAGSHHLLKFGIDTGISINIELINRICLGA